MTSSDTTAAIRQSCVVYAAPPESIRARGVRSALRMFGPGAIIASVTIGSGETLFASRMGAIFSYGLLWFVILCVGCKLVQVYTAARYMILAGEHPMGAWARLPGPRGWFPFMLGGLSVLCFPFWLGGLILVSTVQNPLKIVEPAALVGTLTCGLWCFAKIWADHRVLPRGLRIRPVWVAMNLLAGAMLAGFGAAGMADYVRRAMGRGGAAVGGPAAPPACSAIH